MIELDKNKDEPLYSQIYSQIKNEIFERTLKCGSVLQGSRTLSSLLGISRNTVDAAYGMLESEGYIRAKKGIGYIVEELPRLKKTAKSKGAERIPQKIAKVTVEDEIKYDLTNGSHTSDLFPKNLWRKHTLECMDILERQSRISVYLDKQGEIYLRTQLKSYLERIRGIHCHESQIIITCGLQQSLEIFCRLTEDKKAKRILVEEPGYNKAVAVFQARGMETVTVPVDEKGMDVSGLENHSQITAVYCTPSHQFPTGAVLSAARRMALLQWANKNSCYILEDDFDSELQYYSKPIPSLQCSDTHGKVIYFGTFSKGLSPSIRMGYMILTAELSKKYQELYKNYNCTVPLLNQYVIGRLLETGNYDRHIRRLNRIFQKRFECFSRELKSISQKIKIRGNSRGQYVLLELPDRCSQKELIEAAKKQNVRVYSTMKFWQEKADCPPNTVFMGITNISIEDIPDCVDRLRKAWAKWI